MITFKLKIESEDFIVEPKSGETEDEFISRCMKVEIDSGKDKDQAYAICINKWENK